jgi:hypothetical protein
LVFEKLICLSGTKASEALSFRVSFYGTRITRRIRDANRRFSDTKFERAIGEVFPSDRNVLAGSGGGFRFLPSAQFFKVFPLRRPRALARLRIRKSVSKTASNEF